MTTTKLGATTTSKLPAVTRTTTPTASKAVTQAGAVSTGEASPVAKFDQHVQEKAVLAPRGEHVATSADPGSLWGAERKQGPQPDPQLRAAMQDFKKLSPEAQQAKIAELKTKQDELSKKMLARIEVLDQRYKNMRNVTKAEMLRNLADKSEQMTPEEKAHLSELLTKADGIAARIEEAKAEAAALPDAKSCTPEQAAERTRIAHHIKNLRGRLSDATKAATTYVDSLGLRADRLAVNEQKIDPNAPPPGSPSSLFSMIKEWFSLNTIINGFTAVFNELNPMLSPREREELRQERLEEQKKERALEDQFKRQQLRERVAKETQARDVAARQLEDDRHERETQQANVEVRNLGKSLELDAVTQRQALSAALKKAAS